MVLFKSWQDVRSRAGGECEHVRDLSECVWWWLCCGWSDSPNNYFPCPFLTSFPWPQWKWGEEKVRHKIRMNLHCATSLYDRTLNRRVLPWRSYNMSGQVGQPSTTHTILHAFWSLSVAQRKDIAISEQTLAEFNTSCKTTLFQSSDTLGTFKINNTSQ